MNLNWAILISPALYLDLADPVYSLVWPMSLLSTQAAIAAYHELSTIKSNPADIKTSRNSR